MLCSTKNCVPLAYKPQLAFPANLTNLNAKMKETGSDN